jgi:putative membrane protein
MKNSPGEVEYSATNELAKDRNRAAADRTLLAWIRTSLALIAFGFGIDRIVELLAARSGGAPAGLTAIVGLSFMVIGIYAITSASFDYRRALHKLEKGRYTYVPRASSALIVAVVLAVVGAAAFIGVLVQTFFGLRTGV